jgi:hypothetical protein
MRVVVQAKELFSAVKAGDLGTVTRLINAGFNVNTRSESDGGATALFLAVRCGHLPIVRFLLSGSSRLLSLPFCSPAAACSSASFSNRII